MITSNYNFEKRFIDPTTEEPDMLIFKCKPERNNNMPSALSRTGLGERLKSHSQRIELENYEVAKCDWQGFKTGFAKRLNGVLT